MKNCIFSKSVLIFLIICKCSAKVHVQTQQTLKAFVEKHPQVFLEIYSDKCVACASFSNVVEEVSKIFRNVTFAKLNGRVYRDLAKGFVEDNFPGIAYFRNGEYVEHMRDPKTKPSLLLWVAQRSWKSVLYLNSVKAVDRLRQNYAVVFLGEFCSKNSKEAMRFKLFADQHRHLGIYVITPCQKKDPSSQAITVFHKDGFVEILKNFTSMETWMQDNRLPLFGEMHVGNQNDYYSTKKNPILLLTSKDKVKDYNATFVKLAQLFNTTHTVMWLDVKRPENSLIYDMFQIKKAPACIVGTGTGKRRDHKFYKLQPTVPNVTLDDMLQSVSQMEMFVHNVTQAKIKPLVKSQIKIHPEARQRHHIKLVTGDNFESLVVPCKSDFLLLLTAPAGDSRMPGCTQCNELLNQLDHIVSPLRALLGNTKAPHFGEFLVTQNEFPRPGWGGTWEISDLPVLYVKIPGTQEPYEHMSLSSVESVLEAWLRHTKILSSHDIVSVRNFVKGHFKSVKQEMDEL